MILDRGKVFGMDVETILDLVTESGSKELQQQIRLSTV